MKKNTVESRLKSIEARNDKVSLDKDWETSLLRRAGVSLLTYITIGGFMSIANITKSPWINALVPTTGYILSTFGMNFLRKIWEEYKK